MAVIQTINNGETGLVVRNKINQNFSNLNSEVTKLNQTDQTESGTSFNISSNNLIFTGSSVATATLPAGTDLIKFVAYWIANEGTARMDLNGDGTDPISGIDPFQVFPGQRVIAKWTGTTWIIWG